MVTALDSVAELSVNLMRLPHRILNTLAVTVLGFLMWPSRAHHYFDIQADSFVGTTQQYENL